MADYKVPLDDMRFVMKEVFAIDKFWASLSGVNDLDIETADAVLEEAAKLCEQELAPTNREADELGCTWRDGEVLTPPGFKEAYQTFCDGGWNGLGGDPEHGGMGMPKTLVSPVEEMVQGANISFGLAPMLTAGAALAIRSHATAQLCCTYLPKMYSGQWAGAMDLTEPHCGTDLGLIRTKAIPNTNGSYAITGTKIFITWGDHDMAENIVHLVLAKLPDAPEGSRGISMFLVPKFVPDDNGNLGERNTVSCGSIEKKMGIKASATCVMNFDDATGWLVGDANKGLACMFTMMNYERLGVGVQGLSVAELSYQSALAYAKERTQGRSPAGVASPDKTADNLLVHADVRRMLMTMKAFNEGGRAFYIYMAQWLDMAKYSDDAEKKAQADSMVALLTPVAKAFITDVSLQASILGQQVLGGHGYIREWGQEQCVRDIRITQIYEGTNGIQAMDLIGRKTVYSKGQLFQVFVQDVENYLASIQTTALSDQYVVQLRSAMSNLNDCTQSILDCAAQDAHGPGSAAVDYLEFFGYVVYAYMWVRMVVAAEAREEGDAMAKSKLGAAAFFFAKLLPQTLALKSRILSGSPSVMGLTEDEF